MAPPHPSDVYAQELLPLGYGYPMWHPEPLPPNDIVPERGDVGYIYQGHFRRLFNSTKPPSTASSSFTYETVQYDENLHDDRDVGFPEDLVVSHGVRATRETGHTEVTTTDETVEYKFTSTKRTGALLLLKRPAFSRSFRANRVFPSYMKTHHRDWVRQAVAKGLDMTKLEIILLRGTVQTTPDWTVAAFQDNERGYSQKITGTVVSVPNRRLALSHQSKFAPGVDSRAGPLIRLSRDISGAVDEAIQAENGEKNQCIFLPHYKIKYRNFPFSLLPNVIQAAGGPHNLPSTGAGGNAATAVSVTRADEIQYDKDIIASDAIKVSGPVDTFLDYIIENSKAEIAIACEDDVNSLSVPVEEDLCQWLVKTKPEIEVEDGCMLSLKVAVQGERRANIKHLVYTNAQVTQRAEEYSQCIGEPYTPIGRGSCVVCQNVTRGREKPFEWDHLMLSEKEHGPCSITSISLAPCGVLVATGSEDKFVCVWNLKTAQLEQKWQWHEDVVRSVAFSPTGTQVASGSADTVIYLWNPGLPPGTNTPARLAEHRAEIWKLAYNANGTKLASGSVDATVRIWDTETHQSLFTLRGHTTQIMDLAWAADSDRVVAVASSLGLIWNAGTGEQTAKMKGHEGAIWSIAVSHAGDRVVTVSEDHSARIWDTRTGKPLAVLSEHRGPIRAVAWSPGDREIAMGAYDSKVVASDASTGQRRQTFFQRPSIVESVTYSSDGRFIASGGADGKINLWNRSDGSMVAEWSGHTDKCKRVVFINGDKDILTASADGSLRVWSVTDVLRII